MKRVFEAGKKYRIYLSFNDDFIRGKRFTISCKDLKECYYRMLHYVKDNPYYNLRFLSVYEIVGNYEYEERKFFFDITQGDITLWRDAYMFSNTHVNYSVIKVLRD